MPSREREPHPDADAGEPFWNVDDAIGEAEIAGDVHTIRLKAHLVEEPYRGQRAEELVPLSVDRGRRTYVLARP